MKHIKNLIAAGIIGSVSFSLVAQDAPGGAFVDDDGNLVIGELVIAPPQGTVNEAGDLEIDGTTFTAPTATLLDNGNLDLGGGNILEVPRLPEGGQFIVSWFGTEMFDYLPEVDADTDQWYFNFRFKNMYHFAGSNWFHIQEMDANIFIQPNSGNRSIQDGIWAFTRNLFPEQDVGTWIYIAGKNELRDLRDSDGDGVNDLADNEAGNQNVGGWIYVKTPSGYDDGDEGFFWFGEYDDGNFIWRAGDFDNNIKLRDPVTE
jgi:hypothetical protein